MFQPFVSFVSFISRHAPVERAVANAHMFFNIGGVLVFVWTLPLFEKVLNYLLPDKPMIPATT